MLNNDLDLDNQLERVQDDLAINELESDENLQGTQRLTIHRMQLQKCKALPVVQKPTLASCMS